MVKHASLKDIAEYVGVSKALVSFVLNGKGRQYRVSEEMIHKILAAAKDLNYQPNSFAKSLREGKSRVIGVVLSDISNPFFSLIARSLEDEAEQFGYSVLFSSSDEDSAKADSQVANLMNRGVDGLIFVPCEQSTATVNSILETGKPFVLLDRHFPEIPANHVCLNNRTVSREATNHLLVSGYCHPGIIAYDSSLRHMQDRLAGYRDAIIGLDMKGFVNEGIIKQGSLHDCIRKTVVKMLDSGVDSILFATNSIANEALFVIRDLGVAVPDELGLVGFDGGPAFDFFYSPLSYVRQPISLMARKAIEIIMDEISMGHTMVQRIEVPGTLVLNSSTKRLKAE